MKFKDLALTELAKKNLSPSEVDCAFALVVEKAHQWAVDGTKIHLNTQKQLLAVFCF